MNLPARTNCTRTSKECSIQRYEYLECSDYYLLYWEDLINKHTMICFCLVFLFPFYTSWPVFITNYNKLKHNVRPHSLVGRATVDLIRRSWVSIPSDWQWQIRVKS